MEGGFFVSKPCSSHFLKDNLKSQNGLAFKTSASRPIARPFLLRWVGWAVKGNTDLCPVLH